MRLCKAFLLTLVLGSAVGAYVAPVSLDRLVSGSDRIVVARVLRVARPLTPRGSGYMERLAGLRSAEAEVLETWKGPVTRKVRYRAAPAWMCDSSGAEAHEESLLFLTKEDGGTYSIAHSGRGRLPVRRLKDGVYVSIFQDGLLLPPALPRRPDPDPGQRHLRVVQLNVLRKSVR